MKLSELTTAQAEQIFKLLQTKEDLQSRVDQINRQIEAIEEGRGGSFKVRALKGSTQSPISGRLKRGIGRGKVTELVLNALKEAGAEGITIAELHERFGGPRQRYDSWFFMNARKNKNLKRIGLGKWKLVE